MKSTLLLLCALAVAVPLIETVTPPADPLEVRIEIRPRMVNGIIPVRATPYTASAFVTLAGTRSAIGSVDVDLRPGETKKQTELATPYRIEFESKISTDGMRAAAVASVFEHDKLVTRQTASMVLGR